MNIYEILKARNKTTEKKNSSIKMKTKNRK